MLNLIEDLCVKYKVKYKTINTHPFASLGRTIYFDYLSVRLVYVFKNLNGMYILNDGHVVPY
jgi:hypothetical protein